MKNRKLIKRVGALVLGASLMISSVDGVLAAGSNDAAEELKAKYTYSANDGVEWEKISHPDKGLSQADGIVDYLQYGSIGITGADAGANGQGDRGQSYSYCSATYGDWVYINTMYGGLGVSAILTKGMEGVDANTALAAMNVMYNGNLYTGEKDKCYAGGMLFKFNVKTGETKILMSRNKGIKSDEEIHRGIGIAPTFRYALEYKDKLYFVGMIVDTNGVTDPVAINTSLAMQKGRPCVYAVDPKTDELTRVYEYEGDYMDLDRANIFTSTRAFGVYEDTVIAGGLGLDASGEGEAFLVASNTPDVPGSYKKIAGMSDFDNLPAVHRQDVNGGGGIYQVLEYNGDLYVVICTGSVATQNKETGTKRAYAIYRGKCSGDATEASSWSWTPVVGDKSKGAKYTYGIDPSRVSCGACTLDVYDGYLYIGEYNDVSSALQGFVLQKQFKTQATNLEQSVNMYRMDANDNVELVVGDATDMFPEGSISGVGTGYGNHMNQYTWQTIVHNGKLYVSTMDTTTLLEPIAQFTNGDLLEMSREEWESQINYIATLLQLLFKSEEKANTLKNDAEETTASAMTISEDEGITKSEAKALVADAVETAEESMEENTPEYMDLSIDPKDVDTTVSLSKDQVKGLVEGLVDGDIVPGEIDEKTLEQTEELNACLNMIASLVDTTDIDSFTQLYSEFLEKYNTIKASIPESAKGVYEMFLNLATKDNLIALAKSVQYMRTSKRGFDLYSITDQADGSVDVETLTLDGFGDPYNHGLRIFAETPDYFVIGTANPFYGTQLWRTKEFGNTKARKFFADHKTTAKDNADKLATKEDSQAVTELIEAAKASIDEKEYDVTKNCDENIASLDKIVSKLAKAVSEQKEKEAAELLAANKAAFEDYKKTAKSDVDKMADCKDNDACKNLIATAKTAIDAVEYDVEKTLDENKANISKITEKLAGDLKAEREASAKAQLEKALSNKNKIIEKIYNLITGFLKHLFRR